MTPPKPPPTEEEFAEIIDTIKTICRLRQNLGIISTIPLVYVRTRFPSEMFATYIKHRCDVDVVEFV